MNRQKARALFCKLTVFLITLAILTGQTAYAFGVSGRTAAGEITVSGTAPVGEKPSVVVNGDQAFSGRTFISSDTISTSETSSATIDFGKMGRINLEPNSTLTLNISPTSISGVLSAGSIRVANGEGVAVSIKTPNDVVTNDGTLPSRFTVGVTPTTSIVTAETGTVSYNNGASLAKGQDDDDDDDDGWEGWAWALAVGGAATAIILVAVLNDDDDDTVSPVR